MRHLKSYIGILLWAAIALVSCQDDFDSPTLTAPEATITPNTTIAEVKATYWNDATNYIDTIGAKENGDHIIISGRVVSSDMSGNIYKNLVIQDETGALAMSINQSGLYNFYRVGQEIVIDLTDMYIGKYNGLQQLGFPDYDEVYGEQATFMPYAFFKEHAQLNGLPEIAQIDTITTTIAALKSATSAADLQKWQSQFIRLNNVRFEDGDGALCFTDGSEISSNRTLYDDNGNSIIVRNSGYANFWSDRLPKGYGDVVGILSYYGSDGWQILLNSPDDCMNFGNPTLTPGTEKNPYTVDQVIEIETNEEVISGWVTGYIVGAVAPEVETITSNDDIEWGAPATLANTLVIATAPDVKDISQALVISLPQGSKLREYANLKDNADVLGKQIWLVGKFEKYMGTFGLTGNRGTTAEFKLEGIDIPGSEIPAGDGSETSPYNVTQVQNGASGSGVWVSGYIVGWVDGMTLATGATFNSNATVASNVLIANTPDATSVDQCIPVQLVSGTDVRAAVNLMDNPGNFGKKLSIKGNLVAYFGTTGVKEGSEYKLDGEGSSVTPDEPSTGTSAKFGFVTSISSGKKYLIYANNKIATTLSGTYGYLPTVDASAQDGYITTETANAFTITAVSGGYTIQDAKGRYIYMTGTYNSFNTDASMPGEGAVWTIEPQSNGTVKITNVAMGKFIQFDNNYGNFGSYSDARGDMPYLYEEGATAADTPSDTPDTPDTPVGDNVADFNTFNDGTPKSSYGTYSTTNGWVATNAAIQCGTTGSDANPKFSFIGDESVFAVCLNGKSSALGSLVSPTLTGGIKTLSFNYGFAFSDSQCAITINIKQNGAVVKSEVLEITTITKFDVYSYSVDVNITGDFEIEIVNNGLSAKDKNTDRISIWNLSWNN